jgi:hypothetical protein
MATAGGIDEDRIRLPGELERKLVSFRRLLWRVKMIEAVAAGICGVLLGYVILFALDRVTDTPRWCRTALFTAAVAACLAVPLAARRWIWQHRTFEQIARLIARTFPGFGDQLLGAIEIVREFSAGGASAAQGRSRALCAAAVGQVAARADRQDFSAALPRPRHRLMLGLAAAPLAIAVAAAAVAPEAAANAWRRLLAPWSGVERFTFARIAPLPPEIVVPRGEPATVIVGLAPETRRRPAAATARIGRQPAVAASLRDDNYSFDLPPQLAAAPLALAVGDARRKVDILPLVRPEITAIVAEVSLPEYLGRPAPRREDVRGGELSPVKGSSVTITATASRPLAAATVDGAEAPVADAAVRTPPLVAGEPARIEIGWRDGHGLAGAKPLVVRVSPRDDEPPTVSPADMPATLGFLLASDTLRFTVVARDDFGLRRVGIEWAPRGEGGDTAAGGRDAGSLELEAGGPEVEALDAAAAFCPETLGIRPQPLLVRAFAEDYLPGRGRVHSAPQLVYVVDRSEHALIVNERLNRWRGQAGELRDRETALHRENVELRALPAERRESAETRERLGRQAAAEKAQARRMERLVDDGADLVREAAKNPEFPAETLEALAADIGTLAEIGSKRMPGVSDLLAQAAAGKASRNGEAGTQAAEQATPQPASQTPSSPTSSDPQAAAPKSGPPPAGNDRSQPVPSGSEPGSPATPVPQVVDRESSQQPGGPAAPKPATPGEGGGRLGLPTTVAGVAAPAEPEPAAAPADDDAEDPLAAAVEAQRKLLEEFAKVAGDLSAVMANLEGSTFVKRLKLASRQQGSIAERLAAMAETAFRGQEARPRDAVRSIGEVAETNTRETERVSNLLDDMQAYHERRGLPAFAGVLEELKGLDALGSLRQLSTDIGREPGMSIGQAEFWMDTFDRLADDLVPPAEPGGKGGGKGRPRKSLPPDVVLEALRILEAEVDLREDTRAAGRAVRPLAAGRLAAAGAELGGRQEKLADRIARLSDRLAAEPDARDFRDEIDLFEQVGDVMDEASDRLRTPDAGPETIAAETEAIELLLQSQAANGGGGGGGGGGASQSPGGGGGGTTSALAELLLGRGNKAKGGGDDVEQGQGTGRSGRVLPEEFRAGLDSYFNRLEKEGR